MLDITRYYNSISSPRGGYITKSSTDIKLVKEYNYYKTIQEDESISPYAKMLFPRALWALGQESYYSTTTYYMDLEYIPSYNLFHYIQQNDAEAISKIAPALIDALHTLHSIPLKWRPDTDTMFNEMYIEKTEVEYKKYYDSLSNPPIYHLAYAKDIWPKVKDKFFDVSFKDAKWTAIHGDCAISNILVDPDSGGVKFIDMRGSFGSVEGIGGHQLYDYAKLYHSLVGHYEEIIYDKYDFNLSTNKVEFHSINHLNAVLVKSMFGHFTPHELSFIKAITGSIFVGMCHRHSESPEHQHIMFLQGYKLLRESLYDE